MVILHDLNLATQYSFIQKLISQWKDLPTISIKTVFKKSLNIQLIAILLLAAILKKVKVLIWTKREDFPMTATTQLGSFTRLLTAVHLLW